MRFVVDDGGREAAGHSSEVNDCVCRAIAIAAERPYQEIWERLRELFGRHGVVKPCGVQDFVENQLMESLGWTWVPLSKTKLSEDVLPSGRLVVGIHKHSFAVVDGVIHDTADCSLNKWGKPPWVWGYFKKIAPANNAPLSHERKRLLDIVAKLFAKAEGGTTEAEAASAKAKAAELIARYDIEFERVKDLEKYKLIVEFRLGRIPSHEVSLFHELGAFCGVLTLTRPGRNGGHAFELFGKPQDIEALNSLREIVSAQMDNGWMAWVAAHPDCKRQRVSWKYSFAQGVGEKVKKLMRASVMQQKVLRKDLVLVPRHKQAEAEWEALFGTLGHGFHAYNGEGNGDGLTAGRNVSLSKGVKSGGGAVLRIAAPAKQIGK